MRSRIVLGAVLPIAAAGLLAATGCSKKQETNPELTALRDQSQQQLDALKKHNALLNRKLIGINERLNALQDKNTALAGELAAFAAAPDTMRGEIIDAVNQRFMSVFQSQKAFTDTVQAVFKARMENLDKKMETGLSEMRAEIAEHRDFIAFVTSEQDSLNSVFAARVDKRPWVESILGKWEARKHELEDQ